MTAEEIDVCRNLKDSVERAFKSKRMLRILSRLNEKGLIELDVFRSFAELTEGGETALALALQNPSKT